MASSSLTSVDTMDLIFQLSCLYGGNKLLVKVATHAGGARMCFCDDSMKGRVATLLDDYLSNIDEMALAITINNFLVIPVSFEEAHAIYSSLLGMCDEEDRIIDEPLRSNLQNEMRDVAPIVVVGKMRNYSRSIRKILADSMATSLCRQHNALLKHIKGAIHSNSSDNILALADSAFLVVPDNG
jgi:hypothetical protein